MNFSFCIYFFFLIIDKTFSIDFEEEFTNESMTKILKPFSKNMRQVWLPINPAPPVINIEFIIL